MDAVRLDELEDVYKRQALYHQHRTDKVLKAQDEIGPLPHGGAGLL